MLHLGSTLFENEPNKKRQKVKPPPENCYDLSYVGYCTSYFKKVKPELRKISKKI
jgi:hypothetical protein